mmetsp:Transcript_25307/g.31184  ORF Transcript_25307/g.31184 Transcript_25307/m.31184 type:complete len:121 (-) Transcript_25307:306-668(-)
MISLIKLLTVIFVAWGLDIVAATLSDFIMEEIAAHDVVIFSKSYCPYCKMTKALMESLNIDAKIHEIDHMDDGTDIQAVLFELFGQRTVPNVFIKGWHLGGNDDTHAAAESGILQEMLEL